jgi:hypothetical protein
MSSRMERIRDAEIGVPAHGAVYTRDNLRPAFTAEDWRWYQKRRPTMAVRILGPFEVETREGRITCPDGYLALDAHGWPYPIAKQEFDAIYDEIEAVS